MTKKLLMLICSLLFILCAALGLSACGFNNKKDNENNEDNEYKNENVSTPKIISIADNKMTGTTIELSVNKSKNTLELFSLVNVTDGAVWKVYDINDTLIENKVVFLNDGYNTFYIEVAFSDGTYPTTYTLIIFKSYDITVSYVWHPSIFTEQVLKQVVIEQGELFKADFIPEITGYDFISWHSYSFEVEFIEGRSIQDFKLVAKVSPKSARLHFIINGEEWKTVDTEYEKVVQLPNPEKEHYYFDNWYYENTFGSPIVNDEYRCYSWGDIYIYGKFIPNTYTVTYDYGEMRHNFKDFKYVRYGEDFEIVEPNVKYVTVGETRYVFSGFTYNGEPFKSGKYFYDGNITVTAVWLPVES